MREAGRVPEVHYQVTLDPELVSPSGQYIRCGSHPGDEVIGWQPIGELVIVEKLAEWVGDNLPELPKQEGALSFDFERITDDVEAEAVMIVGGTVDLPEAQRLAAVQPALSARG